MTYLNRDSAQKILDTRPQGTNVQDALKVLADKGFTIEGYNDGSKGSINEPQQSTLSKVGEFGQKLVGDIVQPFENLAKTSRALSKTTGQYLADKVKGNDTSFSDTLNKNIQNVNQDKTIGSMLLDTPAVARDITTPQGVEQTLGDVGQGLLNVSTLGEGTALKSGVKTAVKTGVKYGAGYGATEAMQEGKGLKDTLIDTGKGAVLGGALGLGAGIATPIIKNVAGATKDALGTFVKDTSKTLSEIKPNINIPKISVKSPSEKALDAITPKISSLSDTEYQKLLSQDKILPRNGIKGKPQYILSEEEKQLAEKYSSLLQSNDPAKNVISVADKIKNTDKEVGDFLTKNNGIFNTGELKNKLKSSLENVDDLTIPEDRLTKMKNKVIDSFIKGLEKNDMYTLWQKRKEFDRQIENAFKGSYSVTKDVKKEFRNAIQQFIKDKTPNNIYADKMKEMSDLIGINDILGQKAASEKSMNAIRAWIERNPEAAKAIGWTVGSTGVIGLGASILR